MPTPQIRVTLTALAPDGTVTPLGDALFAAPSTPPDPAPSPVPELLYAPLDGACAPELALLTDDAGTPLAALL